MFEKVKALVITGTGRYFSAGADFGESPPVSQMVQPSQWRNWVADANFKIFSPYITFPKPIVAAVNGPAIGMAVTTASLTDYVVAVPSATFCTPFAQLGVPFEGCSSWNFARRFGDEYANMFLQKGETVDAQTAHKMGLVQEVVMPNELVSRAIDVALRLILEGKPRQVVQEGIVEKLLEVHLVLCLSFLFCSFPIKSISIKVNAQESVTLAKEVISAGFFDKQMKSATDKGNAGMGWAYWFMGKLLQTCDSIESATGTAVPLGVVRNVIPEQPRARL
jgi:enoyl-CoA hydratase/carnithine racemase